MSLEEKQTEEKDRTSEKHNSRRSESQGVKSGMAGKGSQKGFFVTDPAPTEI